MANQGEQFGQRRPPLSVTIKQILERYPDGQLFKVSFVIAEIASPYKLLCGWLPMNSYRLLYV